MVCHEQRKADDDQSEVRRKKKESTDPCAENETAPDY